MEEESRFEKKPVGWKNESRRHSYAARGWATKNLGNARMEKAKRLSEKDELTWLEWKNLFGAKAESMLEEQVEQGRIEVDADECEPDSRPWLNEVRLEIQDGDEIQTVSVRDNTHINILEK